MKQFFRAIPLLGLLVAASAFADMKVYDVDAKYRQEVYSALRGVLMREQNGRVAGFVEMLPTGQILVDTDAGRHAQVAEVLATISSHHMEAAPRVTLRYWAVLGSRDLPGGEDTPAVLAETLDELRRIHGDIDFRVIGNATLVTESGQDGYMSGRPFMVRQLAFVQGATLNADLEISFEYEVDIAQYNGGDGSNPFRTVQRDRQAVEINTSLAQNEFVVVGENTLDLRNGDEPLRGTVFYIVHWPAAD